MAAFGSSIGGGSAILQAMARRGMGSGSPIATQQSPTSPSFVPGAAQPPVAQPSAPVGSQARPATPPTPAPVQKMTAAGPMTESGIIVKALINRLDTLTKSGL